MAIETILTLLGIMALTGVFAGFLAGLLGVGGGIIFVPVLYFVYSQFFNVDPSVSIMLATGTSLGCMIPTSLSSCISHYRKNNLDIDLIKRWSPYLLLGVFVGSIFSAKFGGMWLSALFGVILILSSLNMMFRAKAPPKYEHLPNMLGQGIMGFFISGFSVMLGIGGGTLSVPFLTLFNIPARIAVGTASAIGLFVCIPGAINMILFGGTLNDPNLPWGTVGKVCLTSVLGIVPFSILIAPIGVKVNRKIDQVLLKRLFSILLIFTGSKMLYNAIIGFMG